MLGPRPSIFSISVRARIVPVAGAVGLVGVAPALAARVAQHAWMVVEGAPAAVGAGSRPALGVVSRRRWRRRAGRTHAVVAASLRAVADRRPRLDAEAPRPHIPHALALEAARGVDAPLVVPLQAVGGADGALVHVLAHAVAHVPVACGGAGRRRRAGEAALALRAVVAWPRAVESCRRRLGY